jgi:hypothetical protein
LALEILPTGKRNADRSLTLAERRFNEELADELERLSPSLQVFLPQRYDKELQNEPDFSQRMFACLMGALDNCNVVVAIKPTHLKDHGHTVFNPKLPDEDFDEAVKIAVGIAQSPVIEPY